MSDTNIPLAGFLHDSDGAAVENATVSIFPRNTTATATDTTVTNSSGYWSVDESTQGRFDVQITHPTDGTISRLKYDDAAQLKSLDVADLFLRTGNDTTAHKITVDSTSDTGYEINIPELSADDTWAFETLAQTLTNKTLDAPTVTDIDLDSGTIANATITDPALDSGTIANAVMTAVDINSGTIDFVNIGAATAGPGRFSTLAATDAVNFGGALNVDDTTASTNATTGSGIFGGGVGVGGAVNMVAEWTAGSGLTTQATSINCDINSGSNSAADNTDAAIIYKSGGVAFWSLGHYGSIAVDDSFRWYSNKTTGVKMILTSAGGLTVDADVGTADDPVGLFDEYDDPVELQRFAYTHPAAVEEGLVTVEQRDANRARMVEIGAAEWVKQKDSPDTFGLRIQPMMRLLAGGVFQTRAMLEETCLALTERVEALERRVLTA